jgi:hypothetical protein
MGPRAAALVAGIIDPTEDRPRRTGRPPLPTIEVVEALRFFVREGVRWRELRATAAFSPTSMPSTGRLVLAVAARRGRLELDGDVPPACRQPRQIEGRRGAGPHGTAVEAGSAPLVIILD